MPEEMMALQGKPHCMGCAKRIESPEDIIYAAICGHDTCPSTVWHYYHYVRARQACQRSAEDLLDTLMHLRSE